MKDEIYEYLKGKKILLLGFGREGRATYKLIRSIDKDYPIGISDLKKLDDEDILCDNNVTIYSGDNYLDACYDYDIIIKGPGVIIKDYLPDEVKMKITCQTDLFLQFSHNMIIGITGTKGKSTTTSLTYHILDKLGKKSILMGNVGVPVFDTIDKLEKDTICVIEFSSHQLEFMHNSPHIGVILDVYEEHLDHYVSLLDYVAAKKNIYRYQKEDDYTILGDSPYLKDTDIKSNLYLENRDFKLTDNELIIKDKKIPLSKIETKLVGKHNLYNILVCLTIISILDLDIDAAIKAIKDFNGLPHRMEYVGVYNDITFYDDSIATSAESAMFAVDALKNVDTIFIGGMDRGIKYDDLVNYLDKSNISNILLLPNTNNRIKELFDKINTKKNVLVVSDMIEAMTLAKKITKPGKICLLSPAAPSYGFYKNFEYRGDHFKELAKKEL
jgi:UDP-N-acetylmuramoylalanine--D-glutamate ligase